MKLLKNVCGGKRLGKRLWRKIVVAEKFSPVASRHVKRTLFTNKTLRPEGILYVVAKKCCLQL